MSLEVLKPIGTIARMWADVTYSKWSDSYLDMVYYTHIQKCKPGEYIHLDKAQCSWHILGRNTLAQNMKGDFIFMSDCDHAFAPDTLVRLMNIKEKIGAQVISCIYQYKNAPFGPVMGLWDEHDHLLPIHDFPRDVDAFPVGAVGGGGLLIDRVVFDRIADELKEAPFDTIGGLSEDYSFCLRCKKLNIPVYVAPKVQTHHLVQQLLSIDDYQPDRSNFKPAQAEDGKLISTIPIGVK